MLNRIADAGVLSHALISEVDLAFCINSHVLKQSVAADSVVDVRLVLLRQVDDLCIAATLEVEHTLLVPSVLVVTNEQTLRIGTQSGLTSSRETEEDSGVLTFHIGVSRAVHRSDTLQREVVVHHREHTLLHLATVPSVDNHLLTAGGVEGCASL